MDEQEKKVENLSYEERLAKAIEALKDTPLPTDIPMFRGNLPTKMPDRFNWD